MDEEKNNPPLWFIIVGIILVSLAAVFVMLGPTHKYTQKNQYYLKDAQSNLIYNSTFQKSYLYLKNHSL